MQENKNQSNAALISEKEMIHLPVEILYHILAMIPLIKERVSAAIALSLTCEAFYQSLSQAVTETEDALLKFEFEKSAYSLFSWSKTQPVQQPSLRPIIGFLEIQFKRAKGQAKVQQLMLEMADKTHEAFKILLQKLIKISNIKSLIETDDDGQPFFNVRIETENFLFISLKSILIHADLVKLDDPELRFSINQTVTEVFQSLKIQPYEAIWGLLVHILLKKHASETLIETVITRGNQTEKTMKRFKQATYGVLMSSVPFYMYERYALTMIALIGGFIWLALIYANKSEDTLHRENLGAFEILSKTLPLQSHTNKKENDGLGSFSFFNQNKIHKILIEKELPIEEKEDDHKFQF